MSVTRITGMTSGMDTDKLVKDLMKIEQARYDKVYIEKQEKEWEQEAYRTTIKSIDEFQGKFFDILKRDNYLMSPSSFSAFSSKTTVNGEEKNYVTVEGSVNAKSLTHTIESVEQLATKDTWNSSVQRMAAVNSGSITASTISNLKKQGLSFDLSIDGKTKTIEVKGEELKAITDVDSLVNAINAEVENQFGTGYGDVVTKFTKGSEEFISFDKPAAKIGIYNAKGSSTLSKLNIVSGRTNELYKEMSLYNLYGLTSEAFDNFSINGVQIKGLSTNDTIDEFINKVNAVETGAKLSFDEKDNRFILEGEKTGGANNIDFSDSADATTVFTKMGFSNVSGSGATDDAYRIKAKNAIMVLDGETIVKSDNIFTVEGVKYTLNQEYKGVGIDPIKVKLKNDLDKSVEKIKTFVEDYNTLIASLHAVVNESENKDYSALTDEQRKSLTEDQIKTWETEAKKGLLRRDTNITKMLDDMRLAFYQSVEDTDITLADIGITTSSNYKERGKLILDETKLKKTLETDFDGVITFFTKESDNKYLEKGTAGERYQENGLMQRLDDIISNQIRTTRDSNDKKGHLVEKAGLLGDASVKKNVISKQLDEYDKKLKSILTLLADKENAYYLRFSKMETALTKLQSQASSLTSTLGG